MIKEDLTVAVNTIDAKMLAKMFLAGAKNLESKKEWLSLIHISEPTRRTPISYAVFCLKKKKKNH